MRQIHIIWPTLAASVLFHSASVAQFKTQFDQQMHPPDRAAVTQVQPGSATAVKLAAGTTVVPHAITMTLPRTVGTQFAKISFSFSDPTQENGIAPLQFDLAKTQVFLGKVGAKGQAIAVKDAWVDETGVLWVEFNQPIASGTMLTVVLQTKRLSSSTPFQYGIAAYPANRSAPMFVGTGTL